MFKTLLLVLATMCGFVNARAQWNVYAKAEAIGHFTFASNLNFDIIGGAFYANAGASMVTAGPGYSYNALLGVRRNSVWMEIGLGYANMNHVHSPNHIPRIIGSYKNVPSNMRYIQVPIKLGLIVKQRNRWEISTFLGTNILADRKITPSEIIQYLDWQSIEPIYNNKYPAEYTLVNNGVRYSTVMLTGGAQINYRVTRRVRISAEPHFNMGFAPLQTNLIVMRQTRDGEDFLDKGVSTTKGDALGLTLGLSCSLK